ANSLRLALTGQLGPDALASDEMKASLDLCIGCKACKRECPTGVDMSRMKIEFLAQYRAKHGARLRDKAIAYLPHYARFLTFLPPRLRQGGGLLGFSARRGLPAWSAQPYRETAPKGDGRSVAFFADTFNRYFEPENAAAARKVLDAAGYHVIEMRPPDR